MFFWGGEGLECHSDGSSQLKGPSLDPWLTHGKSPQRGLGTALLFLPLDLS